MNVFKTAGTAVKSGLMKAGASIVKNSPEILLGAGIGLVIVGTIEACKHTSEVNEAVEESKAEIDKCHKQNEQGLVTKTQYGANLTVAYFHAVKRFGKIYGTAIAFEGLGIAAILYSHHILSGRYAGVVSAYSILKDSFLAYRERVKARLGEDEEQMLYDGVEKKTITETVTDENGKTKTVKKDIYMRNGHKKTDMLFSASTSTLWIKAVDPQAERMMNVDFVKRVEDQATKILRTVGFISLNDVYTMLGKKPTKAGQVLGWKFDPKKYVYDEKLGKNVYEGDGDGFVDFGLGYNDINGKYTTGVKEVDDWKNLNADEVWLSFNYDGLLVDMDEDPDAALKDIVSGDLVPDAA